MNNKFKNILLVVVSVFVGLAGMYAIIYFFPNTIVKGITKEEVTVSDTGISKSVDKIYDAVIYVSASTTSGSSTGTGFIYKKDDGKGYIITNYHVVSGASDITILFSDDIEAEAEYLGGDQYADIAVLTIDDKFVKDVAEIGDSTKVNVGDTVFTIGAPMGLEYKGTVTKGILSGKDRKVSVSLSNSRSNDWVMNVMQTDAAINPGNSGGPLCNINGEVIGVNSLKIVKDEVEGLGFSIPIEEALSYVEKIENDIDTSRPYLGVEMLDVTDTFALAYNGIIIDEDLENGVVIVSAEAGSPAEDAGIKAGDVVVEIENQKITDIAEFRYYLYKNQPGDKVELVINRNGKEQKVEVKLEKAKSE